MFAALPQSSSLTSHAQSPNKRAKKQYFIQGAVKNPGVYEVEGRTSLLQLIALAGGLTENHGTGAFTIRKQKLSAQPSSQNDRGPEYEVTSININAMLKSIEPFDLEPGDIVNIPATDVVYVAGEVIAPGSYQFKESITLLQVISLARGLKVGAKADKAIIFREDPSTGRRQEISVDLDAVMSGKQKDIHLLPNDIIVVPNSPAGNTPPRRFLDAPPIRVFAPCRGLRPCMAQLDLSQDEPANERN